MYINVVYGTYLIQYFFIKLILGIASNICWAENVKRFGITWTCCAAGLQIHKYLRVLWGWSSCCCGEAHPAQQIRNRHEIRWSKEKTNKKKTKHSNNTWELHLWSQRLVDFLHQPREGATIRGLGQGVTCTNCLLETERADHLWGKYFDFDSKLKLKIEKYTSIYL